MKHFKILVAVSMAAASLAAVASSASAATLTSPAGTEYTGALTATLVESLIVKEGFATLTCTESTISGKVTTNNEEHAAGAITTLTFGSCPGTVDVLNNGSLTIKKGTGAVSGSGTEVTTSVLGTSCVYGTGVGTSLGTLKGGTPATLTISANLPKISGGFACANPAPMSGKYSVTTPGTLLVD